MTRKFFGTDGIRGTTNLEPMTAETALRVGQAAGAHFLRGDHRHRVVIGKDTRLSGYMMESAMVAGFTSVGMDVVLLGPMPTPAVAMLTRSMRADLGVMISASHNPFADNGIKLFGPDGYKLNDEDERAIERRLEKEPRLAKPELIGRARRIDDDRARASGARRASRRGGGRDGDVEPGPRAEAWRGRPEAASDQGRRPLRARGDAQNRLQRRRRTVGTYHPRRSCHHGRRTGRGLASACRAGRSQSSGKRAVAPVRAASAAAQERALRQWQRAARSRQREEADR